MKRAASDRERRKNYDNVDNPLDKRRIRVDRNKNKLSANYCAVRFAEITPVSRSAGAVELASARRRTSAADDTAPTPAKIRRAGRLHCWVVMSLMECLVGGEVMDVRLESAAVIAVPCGGARGTRLFYKGGSRQARVQCAPSVPCSACALLSVLRSLPRWYRSILSTCSSFWPPASCCSQLPSVPRQVCDTVVFKFGASNNILLNLILKNDCIWWKLIHNNFSWKTESSNFVTQFRIFMIIENK